MPGRKRGRKQSFKDQTLKLDLYNPVIYKITPVSSPSTTRKKLSPLNTLNGSFEEAIHQIGPKQVLFNCLLTERQLQALKTIQNRPKKISQIIKQTKKDAAMSDSTIKENISLESRTPVSFSLKCQSPISFKEYLTKNNSLRERKGMSLDVQRNSENKKKIWKNSTRESNARAKLEKKVELAKMYKKEVVNTGTNVHPVTNTSLVQSSPIKMQKILKPKGKIPKAKKTSSNECPDDSMSIRDIIVGLDEFDFTLGKGLVSLQKTPVQNLKETKDPNWRREQNVWTFSEEQIQMNSIQSFSGFYGKPQETQNEETHGVNFTQTFFETFSRNETVFPDQLDKQPLRISSREKELKNEYESQQHDFYLESSNRKCNEEQNFKVSPKSSSQKKDHRESNPVNQIEVKELLPLTKSKARHEPNLPYSLFKTPELEQQVNEKAKVDVISDGRCETKNHQSAKKDGNKTEEKVEAAISNVEKEKNRSGYNKKRKVDLRQRQVSTAKRSNFQSKTLLGEKMHSEKHKRKEKEDGKLMRVNKDTCASKVFSQDTIFHPALLEKKMFNKKIRTNDDFPKRKSKQVSVKGFKGIVRGVKAKLSLISNKKSPRHEDAQNLADVIRNLKLEEDSSKETELEDRIMSLERTGAQKIFQKENGINKYTDEVRNHENPTLVNQDSRNEDEAVNTSECSEDATVMVEDSCLKHSVNNLAIDSGSHHREPHSRLEKDMLNEGNVLPLALGQQLGSKASDLEYETQNQYFDSLDAEELGERGINYGLGSDKNRRDTVTVPPNPAVLNTQYKSFREDFFGEQSQEEDNDAPKSKVSGIELSSKNKTLEFVMDKNFDQLPLYSSKAEYKSFRDEFFASSEGE
eukprot:snap_masked-scaffold_2-processed-gene-15.17-mRNA-1 protein AED:1.00 eAED:1.00 QI:0/-1/0/0/-1/1/1/0/860